MPIDETRALYRLNIENANPNKKIIAVVKRTDESEKFVIIETNATIIIQNIIPFALWCTGPGLSVMLTQSAPVEIIMPIGSISKKPKRNAGSTIPHVILTPSLKNLPFIKFTYSLEFIMHCY